MVDALALGASGSNPMEVRVFSPAPEKIVVQIQPMCVYFLYCEEDEKFALSEECQSATSRMGAFSPAPSGSLFQCLTASAQVFKMVMI